MSLKYEIEISPYGDGRITYSRHGRFHRMDYPAIMWGDGSLRWYQYGYQHRFFSPSHVDPDGFKVYHHRGNHYVP